MIGMYAIIAVGLVAAGMALGIVVIISVGIHRDEKAGRRLTASSPGPLASGARAVTSLTVYRANTPWN
jgi:hypothetical protein